MSLIGEIIARTSMAEKKNKETCEKKLRTLPLGKPATPQDIIDCARQYGPACIEALADEVANNSGPSRISAAKELLDRGFGKIGQQVELTGAEGKPLAVEIGISPTVAAALKSLNNLGE